MDEIKTLIFEKNERMNDHYCFLFLFLFSQFALSFINIHQIIELSIAIYIYLSKFN